MITNTIHRRTAGAVLGTLMNKGQHHDFKSGGTDVVS